MAYDELSDEDKIEQAIKFVAVDQPLPEPLVRFLKEVGLYDLIVSPGKEHYGADGNINTAGQ